MIAYVPYILMGLGLLVIASPTSLRDIGQFLSAVRSKPPLARQLNPADDIDYAAMLEVDELGSSAPAITPLAETNRRLLAKIDADVADWERRRNTFLNETLGPGWYRRSETDEYVGRDGTVLSSDSVTYLIG